MKKLFPQLLILLFIGMSSYAQNINFSDPNFKKALLNHTPTVDLNKDGEISITEAKKVTKLSLTRKHISSLKEISYFINLTHLSCPINNLRSLDVTKNTKLVFLDVGDLNESMHEERNSISKIDLTQNINLENLNCEYIGISVLDISQNKKLKSLICRGNIIKELDISKNKKLTFLDCNSNKIKELDISKNTELKTLNCSANSLTKLDISKNKELSFFNCSKNKLTTLDVTIHKNLLSLDCSENKLKNLNVSKNHKLKELACNTCELNTLNLSMNNELKFLDCSANDLKTLDTSNCDIKSIEFNDCKSLTKAYFNNNQFDTTVLPLFRNCPKLEFICVDDNYVDFFKKQCERFNYTKCSVSSDCLKNIIQGKVTYANEVSKCNVKNRAFQDLKFRLIGNGLKLFTPKKSGNYKIWVNKGSYRLIPNLINPNYFNIHPNVNFNTPPITFKNNKGGVVIKNFCITPKEKIKDLSIKILNSRAIPGFNVTYRLIYKNKGTVTQSGKIVLKYALNKHKYISSSQKTYGSTNNGEITWKFDNLKPLESKTINITFELNKPTDTPPLNMGDELCYLATIQNANNTDRAPKDNTFKMCQLVRNSWDPNDKTCLEGAILDPKNVGQYLHYIIRFENKGTAQARNINIEDIIDTTKLDIKSLVPLHGSHDFSTKIVDNKVNFIFDGINLPFDDANNDGYVVFKIKTLSSLRTGDVIKNKASIFFDFNKPVITDDFIVTVKKKIVKEPTFDDYFTLSPIPTKGQATLTEKKSGLKIKFITIYDIGDHMVDYYEGDVRSFNFSHLFNNAYFFNLHTENHGILTKKFIKID